MKPRTGARRADTAQDAPPDDRAGRGALSIEQWGIDAIPEDEQNSHPRNLFTILSGGSLTFSVIIIGWFPISFGLSFWQAATAVIAGSAVGAALLAPMGLMGPRTGTNNPVSSGAYFGVAGRLIGSLLEATASLAFAALSIWTGGDALAGALSAFFGIEDSTVPRLVAYGVLSVIVALVSVLGHSCMVAAQRFMIPTAGLCLVVGLFVYGGDFDASYAGTHHDEFGSAPATWLVSAVLCASTVASYGAYAGDWTRHISRKLHADKSIARALFLGGLFGMGGPFMWGTFASAATVSGGHAETDTPFVLALVDGAPLWFVPALIYLGLASGTAQAVINTYGTGLDTSAIVPHLNRIQATLVACVCSTALVYIGFASDAVNSAVGVFLQLLASFTVPWIVIVIIGHFRRGGFYDRDALQVFNRGQRGGIYWFWHGFNLRGLLTWAVAVTSGLLFAGNTWFVGPGAGLVDGADIGFLTAGATAAAVYPLVLRIWPEPAAMCGPGAAGPAVTPPAIGPAYVGGSGPPHPGAHDGERT
ncbi:cytosine permease [Yinghuangia sp. ASG 101]|uniref:purine-cytosine permease family protein n=1 Tax=Yinghuangia sp. ASG 101 TaxID=2896848 RepID=UPI001E5C6AAF|nr:cytosine permease [Yinghuangia sp. ASG 101]UGQ12024.1 cytosine permease [Yinghuangia sp. ASG 101]